MSRPSLRELAALFARIPNLTFGGGDPTMAALQRELVARRGWLAPEQYGLAFGLARLTPGTNLLAFCAAAAWLLRGALGAVLAVLAASAPAAIVVVALSYGYQALKGNALAMSVIAGLLASAVGMMATAAWRLVRPHVRRGEGLRALVLAGGSVALLRGVAMPPVAVLALAAVAGFFWRRSEEE
jgi:chromate transporter